MQNYINLLFTLSFLCAEVQCYCFILSHIKKLQVWCGNTYSLNSFPDKALLFLLSYSSVNNWRKDKKGAIFLRKRDACETVFVKTLEEAVERFENSSSVSEKKF